MTFDPQIEQIVRVNKGLTIEDVEWAVEDSKSRPDYYHRYCTLWVPWELRSGEAEFINLRADLILQYMLHIRLTA